MRSGVTAAGVFLMILGFGSFVIFPAIGVEAGGAGGFFGGIGLAVLTSGIMVFLGFVLLIAGLAASPPREAPTQKSTRTSEVSVGEGKGKLDELEKLNKLKEEGAISEEEFKEMKKDVMSSRDKAEDYGSGISKKYGLLIIGIIIPILLFFLFILFS